MRMVCDRIQELRERRADLYCMLYQVGGSCSVARFEHLAREIHMITIKIICITKGMKRKYGEERC